MYLELDNTAFDIDGVVMDIVSPFLKMLEQRFGLSGFTPEDIGQFNFSGALGIPETLVRKLVEQLLERPLEIGVYPYPGAVETLQCLSQRGSILFLTARTNAEHVQAWFEKALPDLLPDRYQIIATGDPLRKLDYLVECERECLIDDHLETCQRLAEAGLKPYVFDQPWNRQDMTLPRIKGWAELARLFGL
ncbi:MAG: hypothetical protein V1742_04625 [Pseudomonadota bacterium]